MEIKIGSGLDFITENGDGRDACPGTGLDDISAIIRGGYRAPVGMEDEVFLSVNGKRYRAFNLGAGGIGVYLDAIEEMTVGARLRDCVLELDGRRFSVQATVVHVSRDESNCLCGLKLEGMDAACEKALAAFLEKTKSVLLP